VYDVMIVRLLATNHHHQQQQRDSCNDW